VDAFKPVARRSTQGFNLENPKDFFGRLTDEMVMKSSDWSDAITRVTRSEVVGVVTLYFLRTYLPTMTRT
jgi:hypothetical protein